MPLREEFTCPACFQRFVGTAEEIEDALEAHGMKHNTFNELGARRNRWNAQDKAWLAEKKMPLPEGDEDE